MIIVLRDIWTCRAHAMSLDLKQLLSAFAGGSITIPTTPFKIA